MALDDLAGLLHLPEGTWIDAIMPVHSAISKEVEIVLRSYREFLPEVQEGEAAKRGTLSITTKRHDDTHEVTFETW